MPIKLQLSLENDSSGVLDTQDAEAQDEESITEAVIETIQASRWPLRDGDMIKVSVTAGG